MTFIFPVVFLAGIVLMSFIEWAIHRWFMHLRRLPGWAYRLLPILVRVQEDHAVALQHVVEFAGALVVVRPGAVDVHGVDPGGRAQRLVLAADQPVAPAAGAPLPGGVSLVADKDLRVHARARCGRQWRRHPAAVAASVRGGIPRAKGAVRTRLRPPWG